MGWFFSDYRVSPNFLLCWGWVVVEVGLGCDNRRTDLINDDELSVKILKLDKDQRMVIDVGVNYAKKYL